MDKIGYSVVLVDSELVDEISTYLFLKEKCNSVFVLSEESFVSCEQQESKFSRIMRTVDYIMRTIDYKDILYVTKNQENIYQMNSLYGIACCFVNNSVIDYLDVDTQHEVPNIMELTRVKRTAR